MKRFIIKIVKHPYGKSGIETFYQPNAVQEWKDLLLPIELRDDFEKEKKKMSLVTLYFTKEKGESTDHFFLVKRDEVIAAARFQKKLNLARMLTSAPCHYIGFSPECAEVFMSEDNQTFSEKELLILTDLVFHVNTDLLDVKLLKELWEINGFSCIEEENLFKIKKLA